jgi:hypothetical protein
MTSQVSRHVKNTPPPLDLGYLYTIYEDDEEYKCPPAPIECLSKSREFMFQFIRSTPITLSFTKQPILGDIKEENVPPAPTQAANYRPFTERIEKY